MTQMKQEGAFLTACPRDGGEGTFPSKNDGSLLAEQSVAKENIDHPIHSIIMLSIDPTQNSI